MQPCGSQMPCLHSDSTPSDGEDSIRIYRVKAPSSSTDRQMDGDTHTSSGAPSLPIAAFSSTACELGFYKSAPGDQLCARCPPHSHSATPAAQTCRCDLSYYRAALDPPSAACTRKYRLEPLLVGPPGFILEPGVYEVKMGWYVGGGCL
jgi:hypothetical protein